MNRIRLNVNGEDREVEVDPRRLLVHAVREEVGLTGTHVGCLTGDCGACTVLVDDRSVKSCSVLAVSADGARLRTIEDLGTEDDLDPVQRAFLEEFAFQCGYCLPGMLLTVRELLDRDPDPGEEDIVQAVSGNLCRCTGYGPILRAVRSAVRATREADRP
ncbi:(2Fe-2S)-binding protein [Nocardiopsis flavescens]|uniref:Carbon-monoxide dehydrogenase small subunit n=1 Tax=Nocardiopsis flavescens TaxID=758803 RepID=A0A1M6CR31_9ACTN|nr:(2Fe-2S)-binding protein [Nocardiopsis flavescens]SHI63321.1 carbon-monoxide dehydrogenase small subunit [Nocardiopsis flavescens]